ncbi:MAG: hypothetical protein AAF790_14530 [Planctomycetota bacterium]
MPRTRPLLILTACVASTVAPALDRVAEAQCVGCAQTVYSPVQQPLQQTVAYAPVAAPAPVVYQSYRPYDGWYPGKYLGQLLTLPFRTQVTVAPPAAPVAAPTFATAAYRPSYPASYSVGYAPAMTPAYTVARPVTLTAMDPCTPVAACGCPGGAVTTAGFETYSPAAGACSGCAEPSFNAGSQAVYDAPLQPTPAPRIAPNEQVPESRVNRPVYQEPTGAQQPSYAEPPQASPNDNSVLEGSGSRVAPDAETSSYWEAPQLFDARDRSARRPQPGRPHVWNAVYHQPNRRAQQPGAAAAGAVRRTAYRQQPEAQPAPQPRRHAQDGASGWRGR